jgi:hypothetical protein
MQTGKMRQREAILPFLLFLALSGGLLLVLAQTKEGTPPVLPGQTEWRIRD